MSLPDNLMLPFKIRHAFTATLLGMLLVGLSLAMSCTGPGCAAEEHQADQAAAHLLFAPVETESEVVLTEAHVIGDTIAIAAPAMAASTSTTTSANTASTSSDDGVRVKFSKDRLYELIFVPASEGRESDLHPADLRHAGLRLQAWGARRVGSFRVLTSRSEDLQAQWVHLVEWPNREAQLLARNADLVFFSETAEQDSTSRRGTFQPTEESEVWLRSDKVYEFSGLTLHAGVAARASFHRYHQLRTPIQQSYGGSYPRAILDLQPTPATGSYHHSRQSLIEWDSPEDPGLLQNDANFRTRALPYWHKAVQSSHSLVTKLVITD